MAVPVLSAEQMRGWDAYTIANEPVSSIDLMERAAKSSVNWIKKNGFSGNTFQIFCGSGNNGGDGLAIGRLLLEAGEKVAIYLTAAEDNGSEDFITNLKRLRALAATSISGIQSEDDIPTFSPTDIVIDCLFGTGLNRPVSGHLKNIIAAINSSGTRVISIDMPSGLFTEQSTGDATHVHATFTLSFQAWKPALLVAENAAASGDVHIQDIGLHSGYRETTDGNATTTELHDVQKIYKPRNAYSHKGNHGHALIMSGSYGKMGAAVLATRACLRTGAGLTTAFVPECGVVILQSANPEAMVMPAGNGHFISVLPPDLDKYAAIGLGPGIDTKEETAASLSYIIRRYSGGMVLDADALNIISRERDMLDQLPPYSILTPHPKEFERLFGEQKNDFSRMEKASAEAVRRKIIICLKGHHTFIATPDGKSYYNTTGNAGMAKGGSGDILTGIITGLLAQGYPATEATILGVYLHGLAADCALDKIAMESMLATDIVENISDAFRLLK